MQASLDHAAVGALSPTLPSDAVGALQQRVREAAASGTALCLRGGGTKDFYGEPPTAAPQELLDLRSLRGPVVYEPSELVVTAPAGMPLAELESLLAGQGQCLPFEPPHFAPGATVGGMVASGLSGPARASSGAVRDFVLGIRLINGRGELLTFGGQVMKNVAGYDVSRLIAGSLGTLGIITEASLKVLPVAPLEATLAFDCTQQQALDRLHTWGGLPLPLNASCWVDESAAGGGPPGVGRLYVRLRGAKAAVEAACASMGGERQDAAAARDWTACRNHTLPWFTQRAPEQDLWRLSLPQTAPALDLPEPPLVEWHGGLRWVRADARQGETLRAATRAAGGHATLFIAANARKHWAAGRLARFDALKPPLDRIHRALKREFDPAGIFNPGRLYPDL
jgi:glycolate oxidase FAD binding subunit